MQVQGRGSGTPRRGRPPKNASASASSASSNRRRVRDSPEDSSDGRAAKRDRLDSSVAKWVARFATDHETADPDDAKNRTVAEVLLKNPTTAAPIIADIVGAPEFTESPESRGRVAGCVAGG